MRKNTAQYEGLAAAESEIRGKTQHSREITSNIYRGVLYQILVSGDGAITGLWRMNFRGDIFP